MMRSKKRKANAEIIKAITPDYPTSKKPRGRNLPIQRPVTQSDKPSSPVIFFPASYQVLPAIRSRASRNTPIIAPTSPSMSIRAHPAPIIEKNSYAAVPLAPAPIESTRTSLDNFWPMYGDNNIKTVLVWSGNKQEYKINTRYIMLQMSLNVRGISLNEIEAIFDACVPTFITCFGSVSTHDCCLGYLLRENNYVNRTMHARIDFYAWKWVESPAGIHYKSLLKNHK